MFKKKHWKYGLAVVGCLWNCLGLCAQEIVAQADLVSVEQAGFHQLSADGALLSLADPSLSNVRILNQNGQEVPYLIDYPQVERRSTFLPWEDYRVDYSQPKLTRINISNVRQWSWENICLQISPARVSKQATLLGSRNGKDWFVVVDAFRLQPEVGRNALYEMRPIHFSGIDYPFLRMEINDSLSAPLEIQGLGRYEMREERAKLWEELATPKIEELKSENDKESRFLLTWKQPIDVEQLTLTWEGPRYFKRAVGLSYMAERQVRKKRGRRRKYVSQRFEDQLAYTYAFSQDTTKVSLSGSHDSLIVSVAQGDNLPVQLVASNAYAKARSLQFWAEKGSYSIVVLEDDATMPDYDLAYFQNQIKEPMYESTLAANFEVLRDANSITGDGGKAVKAPKWLWGVLGLAIVLIIGVVVKMMRTLGKEEQMETP